VMLRKHILSASEGEHQEVFEIPGFELLNELKRHHASQQPH
jgi:hypothetical protein